jgi:hypothetical protein
MVVANFMSISSHLGQLYLHVGATSPNYKIIVRFVFMVINNQKRLVFPLLGKKTVIDLSKNN